jgi:hypothetical protein
VVIFYSFLTTKIKRDPFFFSLVTKALKKRIKNVHKKEKQEKVQENFNYNLKHQILNKR